MKALSLICSIAVLYLLYRIVIGFYNIASIQQQQAIIGFTFVIAAVMAFFALMELFARFLTKK